MPLTLFNTMTRSQEEFSPITPGEVRLYTCGPTVYNFAHIGNFRAYVFEDVLRRVLKLSGLQVTQVMNLTDVDDKTIRDSRAAGTDLDSFTKPFKDAFFEDLEVLRVEPAEHYPEAAKHVPEMIALIQRLLDNGAAYVGEDGSIYYSLAKFPGYGKLSKVDLEGQQAGARVQADEYAKDAVADFALWKSWQEEDGDVAWDSPWGRGRPGWHIECSAMSMKYLGEQFDIHTGGVDNMYPHHENEIAQSEAATGKPFVNYWMHNEFLLVEGQKMAKSAGNFYTLRDLIDKGYNGREIRWVLIGGHYRQKLNFSFQALDDARQTLRRIDDFTRRLQEAAKETDNGIDTAAELAATAETGFRQGLEDDLNVSAALAVFFGFLHQANKALDAGEIGGRGADRLLEFCRWADLVLGALDVDAGEESAPAEILEKVAGRQAARAAKDFALADRLRDEIIAAGWRLEDTPKGPRVVRDA